MIRPKLRAQKKIDHSKINTFFASLKISTIIFYFVNCIRLSIVYVTSTDTTRPMVRIRAVRHVGVLNFAVLNDCAYRILLFVLLLLHMV